MTVCFATVTSDICNPGAVEIFKGTASPQILSTSWSRSSWLPVAFKKSRPRRHMSLIGAEPHKLCVEMSVSQQL